MKVIANIPEEMYAQVMDEDGIDTMLIPYDDIVKNGTPLPKGHGALKDANKLKHTFILWSMAVQGFFTDADIASIIYNSPTIIKADKGDE